MVYVYSKFKPLKDCRHKWAKGIGILVEHPDFVEAKE
jgi:hypothetical protein